MNKKQFIIDFLSVYGISVNDNYLSLDFDELVELIESIIESYEKERL